MAIDTLFCPENGSSLIATARTIAHDYGLTEMDDNDQDAIAYCHGNIEGELAFAMAAVATNVATATIRNCQQSLLNRLGLACDNLTLEQQRQRGWIVGMMSCIAAALDPEARS